MAVLAPGHLTRVFTCGGSGMIKPLARADLCLAAQQLQSDHLGSNQDFALPCRERAGAAPRSCFPTLCPHSVDKKLGWFVCGWLGEEVNKDTYVYVVLHLHWKSVRFGAQLLLMQL